MAISPTPTPNPLYLIPDLSEFISRRIRDISSNINSCLIGSIAAINTNGTVTVSVNFQKIIRGIVAIPNSPVMGDQIVDYPALVNVPLITYQGGGSYISMPIAIGDSCVLLFCDRDMDIWFQNGQVAPPNSDRLHNINDAIAIVGINNLQNPLPANTSGLIQIIDKTGERLPVSGDIKPSMQIANHSGWLLANGQTIGPAGSGATNAGPQYQSLYVLLGGTWGSGSPLAIPNIQGYTIAGYLSGDPNFGTLGAKIGESAHALIADENGPHFHPFATLGNPGAAGPNIFFSNQGTDQNTGSSGLGTPHNNIQQTFIANWFIKI